MNFARILVIFIGYFSSSLLVTRGREYCSDENFTANCGHNEVILVNSATYGRMKVGRCVAKSLGHLGCAANVIHLIDKWCSGRPSCEFFVAAPELQATQPCPELQSYLQISYQCVKAPNYDPHSCTIKDSYTESGLYMSSLDIDKGICGTEHRPWIITALPGQKINITVIDFADREQSKSADSCDALGAVTEKGGILQETVCSVPQGKRTQQMYSSVTNEISLVLVPEAQRKRKGNFIMKYDVHGCPDVAVPSYATYQRDGDSATIQCKYDDKSWSINCMGSSWDGVVGNCSKPVGIRDAAQEDAPKASFLSSNVIITLIIGTSIILATCILVVGVICVLRHRRSSSHRNSILELSSLSTKYHSSPKPFTYQTAKLPPTPDDLEMTQLSKTKLVENWNTLHPANISGSSGDSAYESQFSRSPSDRQQKPEVRIPLNRGDSRTTESDYELCGDHKYRVLERDAPVRQAPQTAYTSLKKNTNSMPRYHTKLCPTHSMPRKQTRNYPPVMRGESVPSDTVPLSQNKYLH